MNNNIWYRFIKIEDKNHKKNRKINIDVPFFSWYHGFTI